MENAIIIDKRETRHGFVDLSDLYHTINGKINWEKSVGRKIHFKYDNIEDNFILKEANYKTTFSVTYENTDYRLDRISICSGFFDKILFPQRYSFTYNIGDVVNNNERQHLIITDRFNKNHKRYYHVKCLNCNYINPTDIYESELEYGYGCPVCSTHHIVPGYNDFGTKYPLLAKQIISENDRILPCSSTKKINWKCNKCRKIFKDSINHVLHYGIHCPFCEIKYSFSENIMCNILNQLNISFEKEKSFEWSSKKSTNNGLKLYDFFIPKYNCIIELHGEQHYSHPRGNWTKRTLEEEQNNDRFKYNLAINNGVDHYIIIDCRKSTLEWFKKQIYSNQEFCSLFNVAEIDWGSIVIFLTNNDLYENVCNLWQKNMSIQSIADELKIDRHKVTRLLKLSVENKDTDYSKEDGVHRGNLMTGKKKSKPIYCVTTNQYFSSITLCETLSDKLFGVHLTNKNMSRQIKLNKPHKGFLFTYITQEQFNKVLKEFPELCFGDSFLL